MPGPCPRCRGFTETPAALTEGPLLRRCPRRPAGSHPRRADAPSRQSGAVATTVPASLQIPAPPNRKQPPPTLQPPTHFRLGRSLPGKCRKGRGSRSER